MKKVFTIYYFIYWTLSAINLVYWYYNPDKLSNLIFGLFFIIIAEIVQLKKLISKK